MGMTITEKSLAARADRAVIEPGELIVVRADVVIDLANPVMAAAPEEIEGHGAPR